MGAGQPEPGVISAYTGVVVRAYRLTNPSMVGKTVAQLETQFESQRIYVDRLLLGGKVVDSNPDTVLQEGDVLALISTRGAMVKIEVENDIGPEVDDRELLDFPAEHLEVVITNKAIAGKTLKELADSEIARQGRGVFIRKLIRGGVEMPVTLGTVMDRGDVLTIAGARVDVERVAKLAGYAERPTDMTDMVFVGFGILLGGLIGALSFRMGEIPLSLSTSGGAPHLWPHPRSGPMDHEQRGADRLHCGGGHRCRPGICGGPERGRHPVISGRGLCLPHALCGGHLCR